MGLDMEYQAIPDNCILLERSLKDKEFGELLSFLPTLYRHGRGGWHDGKRLEFWQQACTMAEQNPGLEKRNCYLSRRWDWLHYILSANRRKESGAERDTLLDKAMRGTSLDSIRAGQGVPLGYVTSIEVGQIASLLNAISPADLKLNYVPEKMDDKAVYKFSGKGSDEDFKCNMEYFEDLRLFYQEAAACKEGVLVILD